MHDTLINQIIKQETQLLDRVDPPDILADLIDNEFIEIGSSAVFNNKAEVMRWLANENRPNLQN